MSTYSYTHRPGCITAFVVLMWLAGGFSIIGSIGLFAMPTGSEDGIIAGFSIFIAAVFIIVGVGLWQMRPWGWWSITIIHTIGLFGSILGLCGSIAAMEGLLATLVSTTVNGGILYWFADNRHLFSGGVSTLDDTAGSPTTAKISNPILIILGVVAAIFLLPILIITILTLLGPQISDIFTDVTNTLSTPAP